MKDPAMRWHRANFFVVLWFTLWVGTFGFFEPGQILRALPWPLPPLHARVVGALYLAASLFLLLALLARTRLQVRTIVDIAFVWTGWLLMVSILHRESFDLARVQVWFWAVAYVSFPLAAAWLAWASPAPEVPEDARITQRWVPWILRVQGLALVLLALWLTLWPQSVVQWWPWKISALLAQVYAGPVLGFGVGSLWLAARCNWCETLIPTLGLAAFAWLALLGSSWHQALFSAGSWSKSLWFSSLLLLACVSLGLAALAWRHGRPATTASPRLLSEAA